jgi:hypothetical protein
MGTGMGGLKRGRQLLLILVVASAAQVVAATPVAAAFVLNSAEPVDIGENIPTPPANAATDTNKELIVANMSLANRLINTERLNLLVAFGVFVVGLGSFIVAMLAWRTAAGSIDIKAAISNLSTLATETKRQADGTRDQLGAMREQVGVLKDQVTEATARTAAIHPGI